MPKAVQSVSAPPDCTRPAQGGDLVEQALQADFPEGPWQVMVVTSELAGSVLSCFSFWSLQSWTDLRSRLDSFVSCHLLESR